MLILVSLVSVTFVRGGVLYYPPCDTVLVVVRQTVRGLRRREDASTDGMLRAYALLHGGRRGV